MNSIWTKDNGGDGGSETLYFPSLISNLYNGSIENIQSTTIVNDGVIPLQEGQSTSVHKRPRLGSNLMSQKKKKLVKASDDDDDEEEEEEEEEGEKEKEKEKEKAKVTLPGTLKKLTFEMNTVLEESYKTKCRSIINEVIELKLSNETTEMDLPYSLNYIQGLVSHITRTHDTQFILEIYNKITQVFENELGSYFTHNKLTMNEFVSHYKSWKNKIYSLRIILMEIDESTTLRVKGKKLPKFVPFAINLFCEKFIDKPNDDAESKARDSLLSDLWNSVSCVINNTQDPGIFEFFTKVISEIETLRGSDKYASMLDTNVKRKIPTKIGLIEIFNDYFSKIATETTKIWLKEPETYMKNAFKLENNLVKMGHVLGFTSYFSNTDLEIDFILENVYGDSLFHNNHIEVLDPLFDDPIRRRNEFVRLLKRYEQNSLKQKPNWSIENLIDLFGRKLKERVIKFINEELINNDPKKPSNSLEELNQMKIEYDNFCEKDFSHIPELHKAVKESFKNAISETKSTSLTICHKMLKYIDSLSLWARSNLLELSYPTVKKKTTFSTIVSIIEMIPDRREYLFDKYKIQLSMRLLKGNSAEFDLYDTELETEIMILELLQKTFGADYTEKPFEMVSDMKESRTLFGKYRSKYPSSIECSSYIVKKDNWPEPPSNKKLKIPKQLQKEFENHEKFYLEEHKRVLEWKHHFQRVVIDILFDELDDSSMKSIDCSIYQATALLAFEESEKLKFDQLLKITGMEESFLLDILNNLTTGKFQLLKHNKKTGYYSINSKFKSRKEIVRLPTQETSSSTTTTATRSSSSSIMNNRSFEEMLNFRLSAFIVRKLKGSKEIMHEDLIQLLLNYIEVEKIDISELRNDNGNSSLSKVFKNSIESLIADGYIERTLNDKYRYVP
ncbi:hypothetical protein CANARDRAFT_29163 [[Candida] arabinofermentans NRRL YB-2248]|uniref:Cullin family profile domain-containing protein n=1 Tax=[Candida] arabinofermentans NRRL YB-2248 TaxID=983967 RepID=A0A1E4SYT6_9ASCO|nr:hypothetical protein CANARDRAFT_29163 [[Candida] arabinofermentans NRRL YB-2248]